MLSGKITIPVTIRPGRVTTEGDDLYYEVRVQGGGGPGFPARLVMAAGGGDGDDYAAVAES